MFSQSEFFNRISESPLEFGFNLPLAYASLEAGAEPKEIKFYLYRYSTKPAQAAIDAYHELPEAHRSAPDALNKTIRTAVSHLFMREPEGLADFPTDERPLAVRAEQYFTILPEHDQSNLLQEFWDGILLNVWTRHKAASVPTSFTLKPFEQIEPDAKGESANAV